VATGFTFHSQRHVEAALAAAPDGVETVILVTPPNGAASAGPEIYFEMVRGGRARFPDADCDAMIDCGGDAGIAMRALRCGWRHLVFSGPADMHPKLQDMADQLGGRLHRTRPKTVDLLTARVSEDAVRPPLSIPTPN